MDASKMKNMIVIKNLPSNIVDEAFIVLKSNKKTKVRKIEKENQIKEENKGKDYIVKEAEMIVNSYLSNMENSTKLKNHNIKDLEKKCKRLRLITAVLCVTIIINGIMGMFNN